MSARIEPGTRRDIGLVNAGIAALIGKATGGPPPRVFTTLARHRRLFRGWLRFAGRLMPGGILPREDTELVILRVAHNTSCEYERRHHAHIATRTGLSAADVARVPDGPEAAGWTPRQAAFLRAADELHADGVIGDALWSELAGFLDERELIELCMLIGHYEMLAMTLNSIRVEPDAVAESEPPRLVRLVEARR